MAIAQYQGKIALCSSAMLIKETCLNVEDMETKTVGKSRINTVLTVFVLITIIGEVGNVGFWFASESSRAASLNTSYLATAIGVDNALFAASAILLIVAVVYAVSLVGLFRKQKWAPLLVIGISIVNRLLALLIYFVSPAFAFWGVWTIILVVAAVMDYRKLSPALKSEPASPAPDPSIRQT